MNVRQTISDALADLRQCSLPGHHTIRNLQLNVQAAASRLDTLLRAIDATVDTVECHNCDYEAPADKHSFAEIDDFKERVSEGETVPYGECPSCGCLLHAKDPE